VASQFTAFEGVIIAVSISTCAAKRESPPAYDAILTTEVLAGRFENRALMQGGRMKVSTRRFEIERFSVTTSMPFEAVVAALKDAVGRLDLVEFAKTSKQALSLS
jgi:hypothetical protein